MALFRLVIAAAALAALPRPAAAQDSAPPSSTTAAPQGDEKVNMVIIYGNDPCPPSTGDEITVCARKDEGERYRIPQPFRNTPSRQDEAWNNRVIAYESVGATGTNSCSPVGPGGWTGCTQQLIHNAHIERKNSSDVQFSKMIEAARQKRLSTIDADAAKQQADVEAAEKEYEARQRANQDPDSGDRPAAVVAPTPAPAPPTSDAGK